MSHSPEQIIKECANGNENALVFAVSCYEFLHVIDDLVDRDKQVLQEDLGMKVMHFIQNVAVNPFFQNNKERFLSLLDSSISAWICSNENRDKPSSKVLKHYYHEIFWQIARLTGGWQHMRECQAKFREFHLDYGTLQHS